MCTIARAAADMSVLTRLRLRTSARRGRGEKTATSNLNAEQNKWGTYSGHPSDSRVQNCPTFR